MPISPTPLSRSVGIAGGLGDSTLPHLMSSTPLVALVSLSWEGSGATPTNRKNVKNTQFSCQHTGFLKLKMHQNSFSAGVLPRTPLGQLTTLPRPPSRLGRGDPLAGEGKILSPCLSPRRLRHLDLAAFGASASLLTP